MDLTATLRITQASFWAILFSPTMEKLSARWRIHCKTLCLLISRPLSNHPFITQTTTTNQNQTQMDRDPLRLVR